MESEALILLGEILGEIQLISHFIQILFYSFCIYLIVYVGYWFFSRFFY